MEDFALLAGTVALFAALSLVMYLTRRIDWYRMENKDGTEATSSDVLR